MRTIRQRLTLWYTVALGITIAAFGTLLYLERRQSSLRELDQRLGLEADLANRWLSESYNVLGRIVTTAGSSPSLDPGISAYLEAVRDYVVVVDTNGSVLALSEAARSLSADALQRVTAPVDSLHLPKRAGTIDLGAGVGKLRWLAVPVEAAGPEIGGLLVATPTSQIAFGPAELLRSMLIIAPIILLASALMGYWLAGAFLRPVQGIMDEIDVISDGRSLHRRLAVPMSGDEMARLTLTVNRMLARLEASFGSLHRFTADASHELKTPLMVLRAGVERALVHPGVPSEILQSLDETLAQINEMTELVESLLTLARADEGRAPLAVEESDLRELVSDAVETAGMLGEGSGVTVTSRIPEHPVRMAVDRHRIREMLLNLVTNAIKYTPQGGTVDLSLADQDGAVSITVRDTGIGIAPGDLPHIFDRFWRADPARSRTGDRPGTGLGLAITKWIAEAHGGTITVQSRPGRGTVFTVRLPRVGSLPPSVAERGVAAELP
ncbi:MAG TPA: HAMP domain-containing sensor histidine kinase [Gemmatimonadales bacterium]|nr:HAMP domain-containing sensor histidine kinase [Gemmatimonadales bacterium]